jgi:hypothetical protein
MEVPVLQELGYQGSILVHLFSDSIYLLIKYFLFILMHLSFDCIVYEVFFFCYGASVFRLQLLIDFI